MEGARQLCSGDLSTGLRTRCRVRVIPCALCTPRLWQSSLPWRCDDEPWPGDGHSLHKLHTMSDVEW